MADDMQRLVVSLEARIAGFQRALDKANGTANRRAKAIESRFAKMNKTASASFSALGAKVAGAFAVAGGLRGAQQLLDTSTRITNALKVAGLEGDELKRVYDQLFASAQKNAAPLESLVTLYGRVAIVQKELGVSTEELLRFTNNVGTALRVAGTDAQSASGALLQLSQLLGAGTVRAEEFASVQENALPILQAVAAGLEEAGGSVAKLRGLVNEGKLSSSAFFKAFEAGSVILEEKVANSTFTVAQGFELVKNSLIDAAGRMDSGADASKNLAGSLGMLADAIASFDVSIVSNELAAMGRDFARTAEDITRWANAYSRVQAALAAGDWSGALEASKGFLMPSPGPENVKVVGGKGPRKPPAATPSADKVSTADLPAAGSSSGSGRTRQNEWQRETAQIKERTAALQAETAAMAGLTPLINDYGFAIEKARAVAELENAALAAKVALTDPVRQSIDALATSYASAVVGAEQLAERQDRVRESAEEMADLGRDVFGGFISDLREGKDAADILAGALDKIADKLASIALDTPFNGTAFNFGALV